MQLSTQKAFITGATGFIGGRIAEKLWIEYGIKSHCLVRNISNAARLARLPVTMLPGDVLDKTSIEDAMEGCDTVFHCAYGNTNDSVLNNRINEEGTTNICEIALKKGIKKLIYISSVAVYGRNPPSVVSEETPTVFSDDEYSNSKIRAEKICFNFIDTGLSVIIIRPTIVFGPFSPIWTIGVIQRILVGGWENVKGMEGLCNPVYIDDLVDSLFLCINLDRAVSQIFIISGDKPITWNQYFSAYMKLTGLPTPKEISENTRRLKAMFGSLLRAKLTFMRKFFEPQLQDIYHHLKDERPHLIHRLERLIRGGIRNKETKLFSHRTAYSIEKSRRILGYSPRSFEEGMRVTSKWLKHHRYI
jgi:nucleoside-diphosphate-sugar epimerase